MNLPNKNILFEIIISKVMLYIIHIPYCINNCDKIISVTNIQTEFSNLCICHRILNKIVFKQKI